MQRRDVEARLAAAVKQLEQADLHLLKHDVNERTVAGRLAVYLIHQFPLHDVDAEFNRHGGEPKRLGDDLVLPDILVHKRGHDLDNLLVIEMKKASNSTGQDLDKRRVQAFMTDPYCYQYGVVIECTLSCLNVEWIAG